ncbi:kinase-like domain-containing protein [Glomus cerebriforme]|uniref:Kinase-like domain-containing protein n=1 Tax=Glomus cerebriforme TaxID=658196 RepID=A0A397STK7_9GLOM|nr:kinase-like domain-containing protein [Glomus cerebriforme]
MSKIRKEVVNSLYSRAYSLIIDNDKHQRFKSLKQFILDDESLTEDEKTEVIKRFDGDYDYFKVVENDGNRRICENCQKGCLATLYCEFCIREYLESRFSNWTSGNDIIDELIQNCQKKSLIPYMIVEWIPYEKLQNFNYLAEGGVSKIYSANWIDGYYKEWDIKEKQLKRFGPCEVVLKRLENVEKANRNWLEEAKTHLFISNKWGSIVQCYGLTKNLDGKFLLVMNKMDIDLRRYLRQKRNKIEWKTKIQITFEIIKALCRIHEEDSVHRDLHSGNILYSQEKNDWYISDLGFCGPADKPLKSIYGNLPFIAPEVISKNQYTFASDIYSLAILMWEISSEQPPFINYKHNYDLAINIINGMRPRIVPETPLEYKELMIQCWDADPNRRPKIRTLWNKIEELNKLYQNNEYTNYNIDTTDPLNEINHSKIYNFEDLPEPRNATDEEQEAYYTTTQLNLSIPDNI